MQNYRPDKFEKVFANFEGAQFWEWLNQDDVVAMMQTASYLRRPAVEPLSPLLQNAFGPLISVVKVRQMVGHMVRQILEARGYHLDRSNVRISRKANIFNFGSAYTKADVY